MGDGILVVNWQEWQASLGQFQALYRNHRGHDEDAPAPPAPGSALGTGEQFLVIAWQEWQAPLGRILRTFTPLAADESTVPVVEDVAPFQSWRPPRVVRSRWWRSPYLFVTAQDLDGPSPPAPGADRGTAGQLLVIGWQEWQPPPGRRLAMWHHRTDTDVVLPGVAVSEQSIRIQPWYEWRSPKRAARLLYQGYAVDESAPGPTDQDPSGVVGYYRPTQFNPAAARTLYSNYAPMDEDGPAPPLVVQSLGGRKKPRRGAHTAVT